MVLVVCCNFWDSKGIIGIFNDDRKCYGILFGDIYYRC